MARAGAATEVISNPKGGGALRGIGETFAPDLFTGTGNFTVPIALPPGRNGFKPELNLVYSTGNGNGPFGLGWALSIPGVSRKTSKGVPRYRDAEDVFILSGAEDLVPVAGDFSGRVRYRPRTEGLFARISFQRDENLWEIESKDGLVSHYGNAPDSPLSTPAVIADPSAPEDRIFAWKLVRTRDTFGNRIEYEYARDRGEEDGHRWDQLYLKQIRYAEYDDSDGQERFLVSVGFEYSELDVRPDPFSDYRAGFEIRTRKRCTQITVRTHAEKERRVRSYRLRYLDERVAEGELADTLLPLNGVSLLSQVLVVGHDDDQPVEADRRQELPPLEFGYTRFEPTGRKYLPLTGPSLPAQSLASTDIDLADLFGNGLPDLVEMNGTVRYWRNRGDGTFDIPRVMPHAPAGLELADPGVQLLDANGDGRVDLMVTTPRLAGFFSMQPGGLWDERSFQRYRFSPSVNLQDPEVQLVDLDGDSVTDAIRSGVNFECFFNDPREGWNRTRVVERRDIEEFPNVSFSDPRVRWADMSGDGLQDIVLVHNGNVEYWPHLGYGNFGSRIRMRNSPRFEDAAFFPSIGYDPKRILVGDVDGDGLADIVYLGSGHITVWINQSGNAWSDPITIRGTPLFSNLDAVRLIDILGHGTAGILWTYDFNAQRESTLKFLDLTGGTKPYVLNRMDNHMGAVTRVEYAPSTRFYLEDENSPETRWRTSVPFPVQVVARVEVVDSFSRGKLTSEYRYHHGYWDGGEREFRGFGRVDQRDTEVFDDYHADHLHPIDSFDPTDKKFFSPPTETRTWFHLGPIGEEFGEWVPDDFSHIDFHDEFFAGDPSLLPALQSGVSSSSDELKMLRSLPGRVMRDAIRALRGRIVRTELYALDGTDREDRQFSVTETLYGVCGVHDQGDEQDEAILVCDLDSLPPEWTDQAEAETRRVFFPHAIALRSTQWERGDDPMTRFSFTEDYDAFGQSRRQTQIACPRGWRRLNDIPGQPYLATQTRTDFAEPQEGSEAYIRDRIARTTTFEIDNGGSEALLDLKQVADAGAGFEIIGQTLNYYDGEVFQGLPFGKVGEHGALIRSEGLVLTEEILQDAYKSGDALADPPEMPPYLVPDGPPPWTPEYPDEFREHVEQVSGLAGYTFHTGDAEHARGYFATSPRNQFDFHDLNDSRPRGLLKTVLDPLAREPGSRETRIEYEEFDLLPAKVTDPVALITEARYDMRVLQPREVTDPNGNRTRYAYTPLGLLAHTAVMGKQDESVGDTDEVPGTRFEYDFQAFADRGQPVSVRTIQRVHHVSETDVLPDERDETIDTVAYSDGYGRLLQTRTLAEDLTVGDPIFGGGILSPDQSQDPGPVALRPLAPGAKPNVVVSGAQVYDNKGRIVEKFEPYFELESGFDYRPPAADQRGQKATVFYDPLGRLIRTVNPDGSEQRVVFGVPGSIAAPDLSNLDVFEPTPWEAYTYDASDLAPLSTDPTTGEALTDRAPQHHHFTPSSILLDALGRTVLAIDRNRNAPQNPGDPLPPIEELRTDSTYDIRGNLLTVTDALARLAFKYTYDLANNALRIENIDAGVRRAVPNGAGLEMERRDSKGALILHAYDRVHRPTRLWARDDGESDVAPTLRERLEYGDRGDPDQPRSERDENRTSNRLGALHRQYDEAGLLEFEHYDFKGNVLEKSRHVIRDEAILKVFPARDDPDPDWNIRAFRVNWDTLEEGALLDDRAYETSATYDALNRVKSLLHPLDVEGGRKELRPRYNRAGALEQVKLGAEVFVEHIAYDAKGQRTFVALGNRVMTLYGYDPQTFHLRRMVSASFSKDGERTFRPKPLSTPESRKRNLLQDFAYEYDLVGNIIQIRDRTPEGGVLNTLLGPNALDREFEYDAIYRLTFATGRECDRPAELPFDAGLRCSDPTRTRSYHERYRYDALGNMEELRHTIFTDQTNTNGFVRTFEHRLGTNQLATMTSGETEFDYKYDDNGNMTDEAISRHFEWDHSDRISVFRVQTLATDGSLVEPTVYAHYLYDSAGMRVKKLVRKQGDQTVVTEYIHDLFEFQRASGIAHNTLHAMDDQTRIATLRVGEPFPDDSAPATKYHLADHLGSSSVVVDNSGDFISREEFTPYGETSFGSFARKRYRFTGKENDEESGLYYYGARYYAPWFCRWISTDPSGIIDGINVYRYVKGNPLRFTDPTGTQTDTVPAELRDFVFQVQQRYLHTVRGLEFADAFAHYISGGKPSGPWGRTTLGRLAGEMVRNELSPILGKASFEVRYSKGSFATIDISTEFGLDIELKVTDRAIKVKQMIAFKQYAQAKGRILMIVTSEGEPTVYNYSKKPLSQAHLRRLTAATEQLRSVGRAAAGPAQGSKAPKSAGLSPGLGGKAGRIVRGVGGAAGIVGNVLDVASEGSRYLVEEYPETFLREGERLPLYVPSRELPIKRVPSGYFIQKMGGDVMYLNEAGERVPASEWRWRKQIAEGGKIRI